MKRSLPSVMQRSMSILATSGALAPILAAYLFVGTCGEGKGLVVMFRGWGVAVTAAWCDLKRDRS